MRALNLAASVIVVSAASCNRHPTAPTLQDVRAHRTTWTGQRPADYTYDYEVTGFLIAYANEGLRLQVHLDTVRSVINISSGTALAQPNSFPTIEALFDRAEAAAKAGTLKAITYDPQYGFPSRMDFAGPPDASGSVLASNLHP